MPPTTIWQLAKGTRAARCELQPVVGLGLELRVHVDDDLVLSRICPLQPSTVWLDLAEEWKAAFLAKGWSDQAALA